MTDDVRGSFLPLTAGRASADMPTHRLDYAGRLGPLYWIFAKNIFFSILTFGIYRFWGRTNMRRYVWSKCRFMDDAVEYTGTGGELFRGFLIAIVIFTVGSVGLSFVVVWLSGIHYAANLIDLATGLLIAYLVLVAHYAAQRYRLTRSVWRGLRGSMSGSAWSYGGYALLLVLLSGLSLTLAWPWARMRLIERRLANSYFGDAKITTRLSHEQLYPSYLKGLAIFVVAGGIIGYFGFRLMDEADYWDMFIGLLTGDPTVYYLADVWTILFVFYGTLLAIYAIYGALYAIAFAAFNAETASHVAARTSFAELGFRFEATPAEFMLLGAINTFLISITLGLAIPVAIHRTMLFGTGHLRIIGTLDVERIRQTTLSKPSTGEGLLETFDPGFF